MFEFDKSTAHSAAQPARAPANPAGSGRAIEKISLLNWGEHCIECAVPECFATCDLYVARPDGYCRRFEFGFQRNPHFRTLRGYGAEVKFKKWGKLECRGSTVMEPVSRVLRRERTLEALAPALNVLGRGLARLTRVARFRNVTLTLLDRLVRRKSKSAATGSSPDAFLVELFNPGSETVRLQLFMRVVDETPAVPDLPPPFVATLAAAPGYSTHEYPAAQFRRVTQSGYQFKISLTPEADGNAHLVILTADFVCYAGGAAASHSAPGRPAAKCVVFDLDGTLWEGSLLEDDIVRLRHGVREMLEKLDERGILLSVASKNNPDDAMAKLVEFGIGDLFLFPQVGWQPKSHSVAEIARRLDIGLDTFLFVDDNPFEREEVAGAHPQVEVADETCLAGLLDRDRLAGSASSEARNRRRFYQEAVVREDMRNAFDGDYLAFLESCNIVLSVDSYASEAKERVEELVQRTNQLNFSGRKYRRDELEPIVADDGVEVFVLSVEDRFGSYGIVGVAIVRLDADAICVEDLMLSCRVQGKLIEKAFFGWLAQRRAAERRRLAVKFQATSRNQPAATVLDEIGFGKTPDASSLTLDLPAPGLDCPIIAVRDLTEQATKGIPSVADHAPAG